ncbi:hypothetical protein LEN26_007967 [Aphanomyces euteiches]|nr:hypothetical protein AeMF1_019805 [Aphanomyces euteiches]KAH9131038.1 hypothetical protein LEN26_007967 [Aphanomyces euteiches]
MRGVVVEVPIRTKTKQEMFANFSNSFNFIQQLFILPCNATPQDDIKVPHLQDQGTSLAGSRCNKASRLRHCKKHHTCEVYMSGDGCACVDQKAGRMTKAIRAQADALFTHGMTPSQARKEPTKTIVESKLPSMRNFQNCHRYYRKCEMLENSKPEVMTGLLLIQCYNPEKEESQYFSFGYIIAYCRPSIVYNGPNNPFAVGRTTRKLLRQMQRSSTSFMFYKDSTDKINSLSFPVLIRRVSDKARQFHSLAFYRLCRGTEPDYSWAMCELMSVVTGEPLKISYVMSDATRPPAAAIQHVKEDLGVEKTLTCSYHSMANVHKFLTGMSICRKGFGVSTYLQSLLQS